MLRKAPAVLGVVRGLVFAFSAEARAPPTITIGSATLVDRFHILATGTATCTPGTNVQVLGVFLSQRESNSGIGFLTPGTCPESGTLTWSVVVDGLGGVLRPG
jgi:hypothetical protein